MVEVLERLERYASLDTAVLILGETGTGKELAARLLHSGSVRAGRALVTVDCGALPESLAESELFGHERGAFTGADRAYAGRIAAAAGGTLFLDEVHSLPWPGNVRQLRNLLRRSVVTGVERYPGVAQRVTASGLSERTLHRKVKPFRAGGRGG